MSEYGIAKVYLRQEESGESSLWSLCRSRAFPVYALSLFNRELFWRCLTIIIIFMLYGLFFFLISPSSVNVLVWPLAALLDFTVAVAAAWSIMLGPVFTWTRLRVHLKVVFKVYRKGKRLAQLTSAQFVGIFPDTGRLAPEVDERGLDPAVTRKSSIQTLHDVDADTLYDAISSGKVDAFLSSRRWLGFLGFFSLYDFEFLPLNLMLWGLGIYLVGSMITTGYPRAWVGTFFLVLPLLMALASTGRKGIARASATRIIYREGSVSERVSRDDVERVMERHMEADSKRDFHSNPPRMRDLAKTFSFVTTLVFGPLAWFELGFPIVRLPIIRIPEVTGLIIFLVLFDVVPLVLWAITLIRIMRSRKDLPFAELAVRRALEILSKEGQRK